MLTFEEGAISLDATGVVAGQVAEEEMTPDVGRGGELDVPSWLLPVLSVGAACVCLLGGLGVLVRYESKRRAEQEEEDDDDEDDGDEEFGKKLAQDMSDHGGDQVNGLGGGGGAVHDWQAVGSEQEVHDQDGVQPFEVGGFDLDDEDEGGVPLLSLTIKAPAAARAEEDCGGVMAMDQSTLPSKKRATNSRRKQRHDKLGQTRQAAALAVDPQSVIPTPTDKDNPVITKSRSCGLHAETADHDTIEIHGPVAGTHVSSSQAAVSRRVSAGDGGGSGALDDRGGSGSHTSGVGAGTPPSPSPSLSPTNAGPDGQEDVMYQNGVIYPHVVRALKLLPLTIPPPRAPLLLEKDSTLLYPCTHTLCDDSPVSSANGMPIIAANSHIPAHLLHMRVTPHMEETPTPTFATAVDEEDAPTDIPGDDSALHAVCAAEVNAREPAREEEGEKEELKQDADDRETVNEVERETPKDAEDGKVEWDQTIADAEQAHEQKGAIPREEEAETAGFEYAAVDMEEASARHALSRVDVSSAGDVRQQGELDQTRNTTVTHALPDDEDTGDQHLAIDTATTCNTLQHTATRCNTLLHCDILQHVATHGNTLAIHTPAHPLDANEVSDNWVDDNTCEHDSPNDCLTSHVSPHAHDTKNTRGVGDKDPHQCQEQCSELTAAASELGLEMALAAEEVEKVRYEGDAVNRTGSKALKDTLKGTLRGDNALTAISTRLALLPLPASRERKGRRLHTRQDVKGKPAQPRDHDAHTHTHTHTHDRESSRVGGESSSTPPSSTAPSATGRSWGGGRHGSRSSLASSSVAALRSPHPILPPKIVDHTSRALVLRERARADRLMETRHRDSHTATRLNATYLTHLNSTHFHGT